MKRAGLGCLVVLSIGFTALWVVLLIAYARLPWWSWLVAAAFIASVIFYVSRRRALAASYLPESDLKFSPTRFQGY